MKKVSVECRNIRLSYGRNEVLKDISIHIEPGEFFALLGPSGSGKSTLLRLIAGFNRQSHGQLLVDGRDIGATPPWDRNIGMVFQNYALWPHMTVWDNVAFGLVERRLPRAEIRDKVAAALELVGLADFGRRRPNQLSGGQQQRVALARTIVIEPQVLLLDEPLSNLDKKLRVQMRQDLLSLQRRLGITTIFVTHDQEEAMTTADRMAVLDHGVVQQIGAPSTLFDYPVNRFVANFVGTMNVLEGEVGGGGGGGGGGPRPPPLRRGAGRRRRGRAAPAGQWRRAAGRAPRGQFPAPHGADRNGRRHGRRALCVAARRGRKQRVPGRVHPLPGAGRRTAADGGPAPSGRPVAVSRRRARGRGPGAHPDQAAGGMNAPCSRRGPGSP